MPSYRVPLIGDPGRPRSPALAIVLSTQHHLDARSFISWGNTPTRFHRARGVLLAVDDLDAAQEVFFEWGVLARLTDDAYTWLHPHRRGVRDPGPVPVHD